MRTDPGLGARPAARDHPAGPKRGYYYQLAAMTGWTSLPFLPPARGSRPWSSPATTTRSSRWSTPACMARLIPRARLHVYHGGHLGILTESRRAGPGDRRLPDDGAHR